MPELWGKVVYNRQQGAWCLRGSWQGKRLYYSEYYTAIGPKTCQTEQEAKMLQVLISNEIANGTFDPRRYKKTRPVHLKNYAEKWLEEIKPTIKYATLKSYRAAINNWIVPIVGDVFIADLNYSHYLKLWTGIARSRKYRKNILTTVYAMMEDARRKGDIKQAPEKIIFKGKFTIPRKKKAWIDKPTQYRILEHMPRCHHPIFLFLFTTGVRPSESRALQKDDVYKDLEQVVIRHNMSEIEGGEQLSEVKQKEERVIPYYDAFDDIFAAAQTNAGDVISTFVFINPDTGRPYTKNIQRDYWNPACKSAGVNISLNNAGRHSWGNQLARQGVDFEIISRGLGHSTTQTTKAHYADPALNVLKDAVDGNKVIDLDAVRGKK